MMNEEKKIHLIDFPQLIGLHLSFGGLNFLLIKTEHLEFYIESRPRYCDRGRFIVKVDSNNVVGCHIDYGDAFPRYYFSLDCMLIEIDAFIKAKKQTIKNIYLQKFDFKGELVSEDIQSYLTTMEEDSNAD